MGPDKVPPTANWQYGDRWENFTIVIRKPYNNIDTLGPFKFDDVGGAWTTYTPQTVGKYTVTFIFPGQTIEDKNPPINRPETVGWYYKPSNATIELTVQEEPIEPRPATPLPSEYWTRPIYGMNPEWYTIAGDFLGVDPGGTLYVNKFTTAPESPHIMWTKQIAFEGVVGTNYTDWNYHTGLAYEPKFGGFGGGPLILSGRLYYPLPLGTSGSDGGYECVDLRTGEVIWRNENLGSLSFAQDFDYISPNEFGIKSYLWQVSYDFMHPELGATYNVYDPLTSQWLFCFVNGYSGTVTFGPHGEVLIYVLDGVNNWLALWNSTKAVLHYMTGGFLNEWTWRPQGLTMDCKYGVEWNATTKAYTQPFIQSIQGIDVNAGVILATTRPAWMPADGVMVIGYSTKDGSELWAVNRTAPFEG
jgi:hypothetical protein